MYLPAGELSRAVLIGTSDFQHADLPRLPAVDNNLTALCRALTDPGTGILPAQNCQIVQSPDSPYTFMRWLRASAYQAEDLLLVYYAGHGLRHERRDDLYLAVGRTDPNGLDGSAVEYDWVRDVIADSPAKAKLLILDCCYSGLALDRMSAATMESRELAVSGTSVLVSAPRNKQSHSPKGEQYTAFTGELVSLLVDGPPLADMPLTVHNVFRSAKAGLARRGLPLPTLRSDDTSGQVLLRRQPESPVEDHFIRRKLDHQVQGPTNRTVGARLGMTWLLATFGLAAIIAGVVGSIFGPAGSTVNDLGMVVIGLGFAGVAAWLFRGRYRRPVQESLPVFRKLPLPVLVLLAALCLLAAVAGVLGDSAPTGRKSSYSDLAVTTASAVTLLEWSVLFAWAALLRRIHKPTTGYQRKVKGSQ
jgi:hypothetical protein